MPLNPELVLARQAFRELDAINKELLEALEAMVEMERIRYEQTETAQWYFRRNNAKALAAIKRAKGE